MKTLLRPLLLALFATGSAFAAASLTPTDLRCEYRENPLGIDVATPRLSWNFTTAPEGRGARQSAYQILVASTPQLLAANKGDLWSAVVRSSENVQVPYAGKPLRSTQPVFWKVRVQDEARQTSAWSPAATWTMGLLAPADWSAKWITDGKSDGGSTLLRREFAVRAPLKRAVVFVCGLGQFEMFLNGAKVGDALLAPDWTDTRKTVPYTTYDVTALLKPGPNAAALALGNGMYNVPGGRFIKFKATQGPRQAIAQLHLEYADGTSETVITDAAWKTHSGPVTFNCVYGGEDFDARLVQKGWAAAGFADKDWQPVTVGDGPRGKLEGLSCSAPPIRAFDVLTPKAKKVLSPEAAVYDLGQNTSLMPRIVIKGPAGSSVRIIPSELVRDNGDIDDPMTNGNSYWTYTLAGNGAENWFPQFFYRGARYLKVECRPAAGSSERPVVQTIEGVVVHSSAAPVGVFACSNDLFNRTYTLIRWAQRSNLVSIITDCPHREKLGWLEQYHLNGPSLRDNWDLNTLYTKGMRDMQDAQDDNGFIPNIAPEFTRFGAAFRESPEWSSSIVLAAWQQYLYAADTALLARFYDSIARYLGYLERRSRDQILGFGLGDWYDIGPKNPGASQLTPGGLTATAIYFEDLVTTAKIARLLGKDDDAKRYDAKAATVLTAFQKKFFNPQTRQYGSGSQTSNAMPLALGMVEEKDRAVVLANIIKDVETKGLTAGDVGYRYLIRALADNGRNDVIYTMNNQSDRPGYGMQLARGATSLTEAWDALRASSQNHFMLGQLNEWMFHDLAGIQIDPAAPGFRRVIIRPAIVGDLKTAKAKYDSIRGPITSEWQRAGNRLTLTVTIPANTLATVVVPTTNPAAVTESGRPVTPATLGVKPLRAENKTASFEVGSGTYRFSAPL